MKITTDHLHRAIHSHQLSNPLDVRFLIHPEDYYYLEAESLRMGGTVFHPFPITTAYGLTLIINKDAPRLQA